MQHNGTTPLVEMRDISIAFGGIKAVDGVSVDLRPGEVVGLLGHNGAGKSTLIKILSGVHQPDRGEVEVGGRPIRISDPHAARQLGIATVFQNLALVDMRDVAANLYLGREPTRYRFFVDRKKMLEGARQVMRDLRVNIPSLTAEVGQLSGGQRQSIALGRATAQHGRVIIMDEPTAALGVRESRKVLDLILHLKATGTGVVIVSHNMRHVFSVADRILVLRHGSRVGVRDKAATAPDEIVKMIVGVEML
jgi:ABC-type sugar transport system ATPase subunit